MNAHDKLLHTWFLTRCLNRRQRRELPELLRALPPDVTAKMTTEARKRYERLTPGFQQALKEVASGVVVNLDSLLNPVTPISLEMAHATMKLMSAADDTAPRYYTPEQIGRVVFGALPLFWAAEVRP
jgi:hypothetical protein